MKKLFIAFSVIVITLFCSISAYAADTDDSGMWEYQTCGSGVELIKYNGTQTDVYVPSKIEKGDTTLTVVKLGDELFKNNTALNSATLGEGITEIGNSAFEGATNLVCIVTNDTLTTIGSNAFAGCSSFNSVILKKTVTDISDDAFALCEKLTIYCEDNSIVKSYAEEKSIKYVLISEEATPKTSIINDITYYVGNGEAILMKCDTTKSGGIIIPSEVEGFPVTKINNDAFKSCTKITSVFIPDTVTNIGKSAFSKCSVLKTVNIPKGLKEIPADMFGSCYQLNNLEIPYGVTKIGASAFSFCYQITKLELPETVTSIGRHAFWYAYRLSSINIPSGVTELGEGAFYLNKFSAIELPKTLKTIPTDLFMDCVNLQSITIPDGVTLIDSAAFDGCSRLTEIIIPEGVTRIAYCAFRDCSSLAVVTLPTTLTDMHNNTAFSGCNAITDVYYNGSKTQWNNIPEIKNSLLYSRNVHFAIPSPVSGFSLAKTSEKTYMGISVELGYTFTPQYPDNENIIWETSDSSIATVENGIVTGTGVGTAVITATTEDGGFTDSCTITVGMPRGTTGNLTWYVDDENTMYIEGSGGMPGYSSGKAPWYNAKDLIYNVVIKEGVTNISDYAFYECSNIVNITVPETVKSLGRSSFQGCKRLTSIYLPEGIGSIPHYAFEKCSSLKSITLPDSLTFIGDRAFYSAGLNVITVGKGLNRVNWQAFDGCSFSRVNTKDLAAWSVIDFEYSSSNPLSRGSGVLYYNDEPVYDIVFPEGTKYIGANFSGYKYLKSIVIPDSVTSMADSTFYGCSGLTEVKLPASLSQIPTYAFYNCTSLKRIEIPSNITTIVGSAFSGCSNLQEVIFNEGLTKIDRNAFNACVSLTSIRLPQSLATLGDSAFYGCTMLSEVVIPSKTAMGSGVFYKCSNLRKAVFSEGITTIAPNTFGYCTYLTNVTLPQTLTTIETGAFYNCKNLRTIDIPESVTVIEDDAFLFTSLTNFNIPSKLQKIGADAFYQCGAESVNIPATVTSIGERAFANSPNLKMVVLNEGLKTIEANAFLNCTSLSKIIIPESVTSLASNAFGGNTIILCVYKDSTAHTVAVSNNIPYFILKKTLNPEISYGTSIIGTVTYTDGTVATGIDVEIIYDDGTVKETVTTNANGKYEFTYAEVGRYTIRVTDNNGNTASEIVSVKRMNAFDVYLEGDTNLILKKGYTVSGTVLPENATVTISDVKGNIIKTTNTTNGTFAFTNIPRGEYIVKAETENGSKTISVYVPNEDVTDINIIIEAQSSTISGDTKIENRDGTYSVKAWISVDLIDAEGNIFASAKTDADGKYTFEKIPAGCYNIVATTSEMRPVPGTNYEKSYELKGYGYIEITEVGEYVVDTIILREEKINTNTISGKATTNAKGQVIISDENGNQVQAINTENDGEFAFINIPDGLYVITAVTESEGMGFVILTLEGGKEYKNIKIQVTKANNVKKFEDMFDDIPDEVNDEDKLKYKEPIQALKKIYDNMSDKEQKNVSKTIVEKLYSYINAFANYNISVTPGVVVDNEESLIESEEFDETVEFVLSVTEAEEVTVGADGINTAEEYESEKIKDKKGKNKKIAKYYDITLSKNGQNISNIQKQTETNGKLRITMEIPEEYKGHKHYSFIHMHKGEAITLVDLDDDPNTVTFEIDKFSTFALAYSDVELVGEVEAVSPASITYDAETGKISVSSTENSTLYIATYNGETLSSVVSYDVTANAPAMYYDFASNQAAFVWNENLKPLCKKFTLNN